MKNSRCFFSSERAPSSISQPRLAARAAWVERRLPPAMADKPASRPTQISVRGGIRGTGHFAADLHFRQSGDAGRLAAPAEYRDPKRLQRDFRTVAYTDSNGRFIFDGVTAMLFLPMRLMPALGPAGAVPADSEAQSAGGGAPWPRIHLPAA